MTLRVKLAHWMRKWADRIDPDSAPRIMAGYSFTFERGEGIRFREDGKGCRLAYLGRDWERAHDESDSAAKVRAAETGAKA